MNDKRHSFETDEIEVTWSKPRCLHVAECVRRLGVVFRPGEKPWIRPGEANANQVADAVERCPTGALQYVRKDGGASEAAPAANTVLVSANGPTYLRGRIEVRTSEGELVLKDTRVAICRCGASKNKPLCDNAHRASGFRDAGTITDPDAVTDAGTGGDVLCVIPEPDGSIQLAGPFAIASADGGTILTGTSTWLCRCGHSGSKPFCDGSHARVGFRSA